MYDSCIVLSTNVSFAICLRSTEDAKEAEEQPERVVFIEDLRPYLFRLSQPSSKW